MVDDVKGLPDVEGLKDFINQDKDIKKESKATDPNKATVDLAQFKTPEDLLKSYREVQGFSTKVSQENKDLKTRLDALERMNVELNERMEVTPPVIPQAPAKNFQDLYYENPEAAIEQKIVQNVNMLRIADVLEEEQGKNPEEFQERYAYANYLKNQYPHLSTTPQGVKKLFQIADKARDEMTKKSAYKSLKMLFGDDVDIEKLRPLIKKDATTQTTNLENQARNLAYMPDTTSGRSGADTTNKGDFSSQRKEAAERGDVDAVLQSIFKEALGK